MASKRTTPPSTRRVDDKLAQALGAAARAARMRARLTQAEVAGRIGLAPGVYGRIERGDMMPSVPTLKRLCVVLKVPSDTLLSLHPSARLTLSAAGPAERSPAELRRLTRNLAGLSPAQLRVLNVIASALVR